MVSVSCGMLSDIFLAKYQARICLVYFIIIQYAFYKLKIFCLQAREEYRILKHRKETEWAARVIQRHYIQWKVLNPLSTICHKTFICAMFKDLKYRHC